MFYTVIDRDGEELEVVERLVEMENNMHLLISGHPEGYVVTVRAQSKEEAVAFATKVLKIIREANYV